MNTPFSAHRLAVIATLGIAIASLAWLPSAHAHHGEPGVHVEQGAKKRAAAKKPTTGKQVKSKAQPPLKSSAKPIAKAGASGDSKPPATP
jgi:hypothetical protein